MKVTMVIPSYWGRKKEERWKRTDSVYDHPTPLDEDGTLRRILDSLSILKNKNFTLVILGISTAEDIQERVEQKIFSILKETSLAVETFVFSYSHLKKVHRYLHKDKFKNFIPLLQLNGYSNVRNLCAFLPHLLGAETAVLIDDDEIFEDPQFVDKALEFIGKNREGQKVLAVAGYYLNPDNDFYLNRKVAPWMTHWNKIDCMNLAFKEIIAQGPRLKETPFAFGGNMVIHRDLFTHVPFDPSVPRGEDIDFLINARMFGFKVYLDNQLSIKHVPPPKTYPLWQRMREDILRFVFERNKLKAQESFPGMNKVLPEDLDPYPGEFLKEDLEEKVFRSNQMLAIDYLSRGNPDEALECLTNISLARTHLNSGRNPFLDLLELQKKWRKLMDCFSSEKVAKEACGLLHMSRS